MNPLVQALEALVLEHGIGIVTDALLELASGQSSLGDVLERVQRRAIRAAADKEAELVLGDDDASER